MASGTYGPPVESVHYLLLSGLPDGITADGVEFYLSNSFDEVNDVVLLDSGTARAEVIGDNESIKEFLKRKHRIRKQQIEVKLTDPASVSTSTATPDVLGVDCYPDLIEVTFDNDIDTDTIQMYFESKRSGGKREKVVESIKKFEEGVIHVQFESPDDAAAVIAQQEHSIKVKKMPRKLEVCYVPLGSLKKYDKNKLIIKDIPKGVEEEFLSLFIEKHLGLDEEDFTIVLRPNVAILILKYSYTDEELNEMVEKLRVKKLKKEQLTIERCEVNYNIYVAGITNKVLASEDGLELYFESSKSGGGEGVVEKIEMLAKDKAKVTFKDHSVIQEVLKKKHTKLGPSVCITECSILDSLDDGTIEDEEEEEKPMCKTKSNFKRDNKAEEKCLNISKQKKSKKKNSKTFSSSDDDETHASSLPLVEVVTSQVPLYPVHYPLDPLLAKYVRLKPDVTIGIEMEFQVKITADDAGIITISPSPSSPPDWPEKAVDMMQEFISSSLTKVDLPVPPEVSSSVYPMVMKECNDEGLQYAFGQGSNKVAIAGHIDAVTKLQHNIALCTDTTATAFHTEEIADPNIAVFSDETVHELKSFASDHNVDIEIDRDPVLHSVHLEGLFQDVMLVIDKIRDAISSISQEQSNKAAAAALVSKTVCWVRINPDDEEEEEYGELLNYEIEQAFQNKKEVYDAADYYFIINFGKMEERDKITDKTAFVKRLDLL